MRGRVEVQLRSVCTAKRRLRWGDGVKDAMRELRRELGERAGYAYRGGRGDANSDITRQVRCCARAWDGTRERGVEGERDGERGGESETQHEMLMDHVLLHSTPQR